MLSKFNTIGRLALLALIVTAITSAANAGDYKTEAHLQRVLERSRAAVSLMRGASHEVLQKDLMRLKTMARGILSAHRLLEERFERRTEIVREIGPKAVQRHAKMMERYRRFMRELGGLLAAENLTPEYVEKLRILLEGAMPRRNKPIHGSMPYKHLNWPARETLMSPIITPAYQGGNTQVTVDDTASTPESPISTEIAELAESLEWNPVKIYEYLKNNVESEWYYGCMKGAVETLRQGSGNDCDQATLLVALLRASGYPTRYVRGVIEFFPDIETAKNLTGVEDENQLVEFFQKAGIPFRQIIAGGKIKNVQIEHIWVEVRVPYDNYRGVVVDEAGKAWLGLDTSIKASGYTYNDPQDLPDGVPLANIRDYYLQADRPETPLEYLRAEIEQYLSQNQPDLSYSDLIRARTLNPEGLKILPASLQFEQVVVTHEYKSIPEELLHKTRIMITYGSNNVMLDTIQETFNLSNKSIAIYYEPDTVEDQEVINAFGGLDNTPAYLVHLRPVVRLDGERLIVGRDGLPMGDDAVLSIDLISPHGTERVTNDLIVGNLVFIGVAAQNTIPPPDMPMDDKNAERLYREETTSYIGRWREAEEELSSLLHLAIIRPLPSLVTMGGVIEVTYLLDTPHGYEWRGAFVDADLRTIESAGDVSDRVEFMRFSSLHGSVLEDRILREDFQVESISTARLFALANSNQITILTIDSSNIYSILPVLPYSENVKEDIVNSVFQGLIVAIPETELTFEDWIGIGYLKENTVSGESGWMLSGMIAGGHTAWGVPRWPSEIAELLKNPNSVKPKEDPSEATAIYKITRDPYGTVGTIAKLQALVTDDNYIPVNNVVVSFKILDGCGWFGSEGANITKVTAVTKDGGIATVEDFHLGKSTDCNPILVWKQGVLYHQQVGENIVDAYIESSNIGLVSPFSILGFPDLTSMTLSMSPSRFESRSLRYAGCVGATVKDNYGNNISNIPVTFEALTPIPLDECRQVDYLPTLLLSGDSMLINSRNTYADIAEEGSITLEDTTRVDGVNACVFVGSARWSEHPIEATVSYEGNNLHASSIIETEISSCGSTAPFWSWDFGFIGNVEDGAGKVGESEEFISRLVFIFEDEDWGPSEFTGKCCDGGATVLCGEPGASELVCPTVIGLGNVNYDSELLYDPDPSANSKYHPNASFWVDWGPLGSSFLGGSIYLGDGYFKKEVTLPTTPGKHTFFVDYSGGVDRNGDGFKGVLPECPSCRQITDGYLWTINALWLPRSELTFDYWVVKIDIKTGEDSDVVGDEYVGFQANIFVDQAGYALEDTTINYEILPSEFEAHYAYIEVLKDGKPYVYIPTNKQGADSVTLSKGFKFDLDGKYTSRIVLIDRNAKPIDSDEINIELKPQHLISVEKKPIVLERKHHNAEFDASGTQVSSYTDDFKIVKFILYSPATVSINLLDDEKNELATLVQDMEFTIEQVPDATEFAFVLDYDTVRQHVDPGTGEHDFYVQVEANFPNEQETLKEETPGRLSEIRQGFMLGTIVAHDVLIADGSLTLTREDFSLKGRGPDLTFLRSYSNRGSVRGDSPLGGGWNHNYDKRVTMLRSNSMQDGPIPQWVVGLRDSGIFRADAVPQAPEAWNQISINGAQFRKVDGEWQVERGRRSRLVQDGEEYVFTSLDGTRYYFGIPDDFPYYEFPSARFQEGGATGGQCQDKSRLRRIVDRNGNELVLTYDALCQVRVVEDAVGRRLKFNYREADSNYFGKLSVIDTVELLEPGQEENGIVVVRYLYNSEGYLERVERDVTFNGSPDDVWYERYEYERERPDDSFDYNLVSTFNAKEERFSYEYHQPGEIGYSGDLYGTEMKDEDVVKSVSYPASPIIHTATFDYDFNSKTRTVADLRGNATTYELNEFGNPLRIVEPTVDGGEQLVTTLQWSLDHGLPGNDLISRSVTNVNAAGSETRNYQFTYQYNENTRVETRRDPYNNEVVTVFDSNFNVPLTRTDRNGNVESWNYDPNGNLLVYTDADQKTVAYTYNSFGERETKTLQGNAVSTAYTYDSYGNLDTITEPEGSSRDLDHDLWGRLMKEVDPHGNATLNRYDSIGRLREVEHQPQNLADIVAPVSQHLNLVRTIEYDPAGNKILEDDLNGLELHYTYTARGQVATIQRKDGGTTYGQKSFQYDPNGNVLSETDWLGQSTSHTYDQRNRRLTTTNRLSRTMSIEYDTVGNLLQATDFEGNVTSYTYDLLDREVNRTVMGDGGGTIGRTYYKEEDPRRNLKTITDQGGKTTTYEYNGRYLITRIIDPLQANKGGLGNPDMGHRIEYDSKSNKTGEIDAENNVTNYEYDQENRLTATERLKKEGGAARTVYDYSNYIASKMVVDTDPLGKSKQTFYDPWNRVKKIVDADGYDKESWYDGEGSIVLMRDGRGLTRQWERDRRGLVQSYYDAVAVVNPTYRYEYNNNDKLTRKLRIREVGGAVGYVETETQYDAEDREQQVVEAKALAEERRIQYLSRDGMGNPLEVLDYNGNKTTYEYNAIYKVKKEIDNREKAIEYEYYLTGKLHKKIDRRNADETRTTTYEYDLLDREKRVEDPLGQSVHRTYDDVGNPLTVTDKRSIVTEHEYDSLYRRTRTVRAGQQVERKVYNDVGNVTAEHDAYDILVRGFEYNDRHLLSKTVFHNDNDVTTNEQRQYDGNGNLTTLIDEEGKPTTYAYDGENRQLTSTFEGETTEKEYDKIGNLVALILPECAAGEKFANRKKKYAYDAHNRLVRVEEEPTVEGTGGLVTRYGYDPNGNLRHIYDPLDNHVEYVYDDLDRRTQHIQHKNTGNLVTHFEYDNVGNLTKVTDAKGQEFVYTYDRLDRRDDATYPEVPSPLHRLAHIDFDYDPNSNLKTVTERKYKPDDTEHIDVISNNYDNFDRLDDSTRRGVLIDYTYDNNGNRLSVTTPNHSTSYTYMRRNWVKTATLGGQTTTFNYLPDGKLDRVIYPNDMESDYNYHPTNRIQSITHTNSSGVVYSYAYTYDKNGNRMAQEEFNDGITETTDYAYDPMNRLLAYTITGHSAPFMREYTYEGYNRKTETTYESGSETDSKTYFYDQTNWLTRVASNTYAIDYTYDNNGNTLTKVDSRTPNDPINFQYSANDRLVQATKGLPGSEQILGQFDYNHEGNRIRHRYSDRGDVDYYYDDGAVLEERNAADDSLLAYYQYADRLIALAQPLGTQYYHHDALGSTIGLTDQNGADKKSYHLDPWGNIRWETGTSDNRHIFTGKEHDKNTGLVYFGARYYDPEIGRFVTQDTYLGENNQPPSLHRYLYANSNPTVYVDQEGRFAVAGVALGQYYGQWGDRGAEEPEEGELIPGGEGQRVQVIPAPAVTVKTTQDITVESVDGSSMENLWAAEKKRTHEEFKKWQQDMNEEEEGRPDLRERSRRQYERLPGLHEPKKEYKRMLAIQEGSCGPNLCDIEKVREAQESLREIESLNPFDYIARYGQRLRISASPEYAKAIPPALRTAVQAETARETYQVGTIATLLWGGLSGLRPGTFARKAELGTTEGAVTKLAPSTPREVGRRIESIRRSAVRKAWQQEAELVKRTGRGTRPWTKKETIELLETGKVKGYQGHHVRSVKAHPEWAGDPNNVTFNTVPEHLEAHGGSWRTPTWGELVKRVIP